MNKKILFISGTRADFGKLKPIINKTLNIPNFTTSIFVTGMHMLSKYGYTYEEVKNNFSEIVYGFVNQNSRSSLDEILSKTILGLSDFVRENMPDLIIVHGDRVEALAGAIVGSLNNIRVAHIEGGEVSGTIDESIRHAVTKFSHIHFVANSISKHRLIKMGEDSNSIFEIGSPDFDVMTSNELPSIIESKSHYSIPFSKYSIVLFHPVTTELSNLKNEILDLVQALNESKKKYIVIMPNNDPGSEIIHDAFEKNLNLQHCKYFPSIRFEYFLTLLKNSEMIIGNSSAGIREAPFFGIPTINIGSRQNKRSNNPNIINIKCQKKLILDAIYLAGKVKLNPEFNEFGFLPDKTSSDRFIEVLINPIMWEINIQKTFNEMS
jgi:UDP-N-acetylglucosamine 2-epimerase (hydrolysing)